MADIQIIKYGDDNYPKRLMELNNPPEKLYCMGDISLLENRMAAIVGSRKSSTYGKWAAESIAKALSGSGITVISGMAKGIDTAAHLGAIDGRGKTVAVLGCGIDMCYPAENRNLKRDIVAYGLVISEYPPGTEAKRWTFPKRNRIIAGLSELVVVVEAGLNSGALITAELAAAGYGKVMAVPGNIAPVVVIGDVLESMGIYEVDNGDNNFESVLGTSEKEVYMEIKFGGEISVDEVCRRVKRAPGYVNGIIAVLEMKGLVRTSMGKVFVAK